MVRINPMRIPGNWRQGYVLDYHILRSEFLGHDEFGHPMFNTTRSEIGELLYKLKYKSDRSTVDAIIEAAANFIASWKLALDLILPTPPSRQRAYQPVLEVAQGLGARLGIQVRDDCIVKVQVTPELKNVYDYDKRLKLLENAYDVDTVALKGKNVLLFDDLYRSGATLDALTNATYAKGEAANVYVLALTRTRSAL
jgi:predicted amidophosphoribosyltransferase